MGHYLRHAHETLLLFKKGKLNKLRKMRNHDVVVAPREVQSAKPFEIYEVLEQLWPGARRLELFGRRHNCRTNWHTVGLEV